MSDDFDTVTGEILEAEAIVRPAVRERPGDGNEVLYDFKARSDAAGLVCDEPSKTVQSQMMDADINVIVHRFGITGRMPDNVRIPQYVDYEGVFDYHSAQRALLEADREFNSMTAQVRAQFENDPGIFFAYATNPDNIEGMRALGLAKPVVPAIIPVVPPVIPPVA